MKKQRWSNGESHADARRYRRDALIKNGVTCNRANRIVFAAHSGANGQSGGFNNVRPSVGARDAKNLQIHL